MKDKTLLNVLCPWILVTATGAASERERLDLQLRGKDSVECGTLVLWHKMKNFGSAFAPFHPGPENRDYEAVKRPKGSIQFAGEHTVLEHRWNEGAVRSGIRTASEIAG